MSSISAEENSAQVPSSPGQGPGKANLKSDLTDGSRAPGGSRSKAKAPKALKSAPSRAAPAPTRPEARLDQSPPTAPVELAKAAQPSAPSHTAPEPAAPAPTHPEARLEQPAAPSQTAPQPAAPAPTRPPEARLDQPAAPSQTAPPPPSPAPTHPPEARLDQSPPPPAREPSPNLDPADAYYAGDDFTDLKPEPTAPQPAAPAPTHTPEASQGSPPAPGEPARAPQPAAPTQTQPAAPGQMSKEEFNRAVVAARSASVLDVAQSYGVRFQQNGQIFRANCPLPDHKDQKPSFTVHQNQPMRYRCYGCGSHGDAIEFVRQLKKLDFAQAVTLLGASNARQNPQLAQAAPRAPYGYGTGTSTFQKQAATNPALRPLSPKQKEIIDRVVKACQPLPGTLTETYLQNRGLDTQKLDIERGLAHHPSLPYLHYDPDMKKLIQLGTFPAMVGLVRNAEGKIRGLHLTWLDQAGQGKLNLAYKDVPLPPRKMIGPTLGGFIAFQKQLPEKLGLAEGVETALSVKELYGQPTLAGLSYANLVATGQLGQSRLQLPTTTRALTLFGDGDDKHITPTRMEQVMGQLRRTNPHIEKTDFVIAKKGMDFNDVLKVNKGLGQERQELGL